MKIFNIIPTRCHILRLKCTKFDLGWGSRWGSSQRCPMPYSRIQGVLLLRGEKETRGKGREKDRRKKEREGKWEWKEGELRQDVKGKEERKGEGIRVGGRLPPGAEGGWTPLNLWSHGSVSRIYKAINQQLHATSRLQLVIKIQNRDYL